MTVEVKDGLDPAGNPDPPASNDNKAIKDKPFVPIIDDKTTVTIDLTNVNEAPTITNAQTTASFAENGTGTVVTFAATDVDASDTLEWSVESGDDDDMNDYEVTVKVEDAGGLDDTHMITVNVTNVNEAPTIDSGPSDGDTINVDENTATSEIIATYEASDVDASTNLTWSKEGDDAGDFTITKNTVAGDGELRFSNVPNYEMEADTDTDNDYEVTVKVSDGPLSATRSLTVRVDDVNEAPTIDSGPSDADIINVGENTATTEIIATYEASDVDASTNRTWTREGDDAGDFIITKNTMTGYGELRFRNVPNYEMEADTDTDNDYEVTVKVSDGPLSATRSLTVRVDDVNEAPTIDSGPSDADIINVGENTATTEIIATYEASDVDASTNLTWSKEGDDAGDFTITKNTMTGYGELRFRNVPNYEMEADDDTDNDYEVTVKVSDGPLNATRSLTVRVDDVNDTPVVSGDATPSFMEIEFDVDSEDLIATDYEIGAYTAEDEDEDEDPGDTITWGLSGTDAAHFSIDNTTGVLSFSIEPDFENPADVADSNNMGASNNEYKIVVEADDGQGESNSVGTFDATVTVTNVNETPEITGGDDAPFFEEIEWDADTADLTVETYTARDEETETITWSLGGDDAGDFTIDSSTGKLSFAQRPNYEMPAGTPATPGDEPDNTYQIVVKARDTNSNTREYPVTVTVTNVDETPEITDPPADITDYPRLPTIPTPPRRLSQPSPPATRRDRTLTGTSAGMTVAIS